MPLKITCREFCPKCGERLHTLGERYVRYHGRCSCPMPPGPTEPPRRFEKSQVIFEPGTEEQIEEDKVRAEISRRKKETATGVVKPVPLPEPPDTLSASLILAEPPPFTCSICNEEKPASKRATLFYTDTGEPIGPEVCGPCVYEGLLWAAEQARSQPVVGGGV